jgi:hypothetical protein
MSPDIRLYLPWDQILDGAPSIEQLPDLRRRDVQKGNLLKM